MLNAPLLNHEIDETCHALIYARRTFICAIRHRSSGKRKSISVNSRRENYLFEHEIYLNAENGRDGTETAV